MLPSVGLVSSYRQTLFKHTVTQIDGMPRCHTVTDISSVCFYETAAAVCYSGSL